ncbi:MAG: GtrA family protein [Burkholderiales bacterium]|nr:GtrA family protein [Burkholderiales bacterium]
MNGRVFQAVWSRQFLVFATGGVVSALVDIGSMLLLLRSGVTLLTGTSCAFVFGLAVNYMFHAHITFQTQRSLSSAGRFLIIVGVNYLTTLAFVFAGQALLASPLAGKIASLPVVAVTGFLLSKHWAFR